MVDGQHWMLIEYHRESHDDQHGPRLGDGMRERGNTETSRAGESTFKTIIAGFIVNHNDI